MSMDTSALPFSKGRPVALVRADRRSALKAQDDKWSKAVRKRSGGQCEVREVVLVLGARAGLPVRCSRRACHVHHMIGGHGKRGRGDSAQAIRKQHVCPEHHTAIGNHTMRRVVNVVPHYLDVYERIK